MYVSFELRQGDANKDGKRTIRAYISHNGRAYYSTKHSCSKSDWDAKRGRVKETRPNDYLLNSELKRIQDDIESLCLRHPNMPAMEVRRLIGKGSIDTFISFFENYIKNCENGKEIRSWGTVKNYKKVLKTFTGDPEDGSYILFADTTNFNTINKGWYENYTSWLRNDRKQSENTIGGYIKVIKTIMREAYECGVSNNEEYRKRYFKKPSEETDSIYLTADEMNLWIQTDLSSYDYLQAERDRFTISYFFLLRFGDSLRFDKSNIYKDSDGHFLKIKAEKTGHETIAPIKPIVYELLKKYDFKMPYTTNSDANSKLKEIGRIANINELASLGPLKRPKYDFITTHTARRSGATNLYLQKVPDKIIMDLGGWKRVEQFRDYIRLSKLESAKKAMDFEFFK